MENIFIEIGSAIKKARKEKKLTMQDLSQQVGLSQSAISMIENGLRQPSIQTLKKFSIALNVDFTSLIQKVPETDHINDSIPSNKLLLNTQDFQVNIELEDFQCSYSDPDIQQAIYNSLNDFLNTLFTDSYVSNKLDEHMKLTIERTLEEKQRELNKLYNRINS